MEDIGEVGVCARATCMSSSDVVAPCGAVISVSDYNERRYRLRIIVARDIILALRI